MRGVLRPAGAGVLLAVTLTLFSWCAPRGVETSPSAEALYQEAQDEIHKSMFPDFQVAIDDYQRVIDQYPYSPFAPMSEIGIADVNFKKGDYAEAVERYREFEKRHPTHDLVPYAIYQRGRAYEALGDAIDRDQTPIENALSEFTRLTENYPASPYARKARPEMQKLRGMLAERLMYIAQFYERGGMFEASADRFHELADRYPDLDLAPQALYDEARVRLRFHDAVHARAAVARLEDGYPESPWARSARTLLHPVPPAP